MGVNKVYNVYKGLKKAFSKTDDTITGMKPTTGKTDTKEYKFNLMKNRLKNQTNKLKGDK